MIAFAHRALGFLLIATFGLAVLGIALNTLFSLDDVLNYIFRGIELKNEAGGILLLLAGFMGGFTAYSMKCEGEKLGSFMLETEGSMTLWIQVALTVGIFLAGIGCRVQWTTEASLSQFLTAIFYSAGYTAAWGLLVIEPWNSSRNNDRRREFQARHGANKSNSNIS